MRGFVFAFLLGLALLLSPSARGEVWYMRVVARDDGAPAQAEKLLVRDAALAACPEEQTDLLSALPGIRAAAKKIAPCAVETRLWSPGGQTPLAPTLYITIGPGAGRNWWGVLYADAPLMTGEKTETEEILFVWPFLSWLRALFTGR